MSPVTDSSIVANYLIVTDCHESDVLLFFFIISLSHLAYALNGPEQIPII
jgi:hypothetical protein